MVNHDDAPRSEEPSASGRHNTDRAGSENYDCVAPLNAAHLCRLIAGRHYVREHHRIVQVHAFGDNRRADVRVRHADVLRLSAVVAARRVRIAEDAAHRRSFGIGFVAVAVKFLLAEGAFPTRDVERHEDLIADFEFLDLRAEFFDHAGNFMPKRHPDARVRHRPVV